NKNEIKFKKELLMQKLTVSHKQLLNKMKLWQKNTDSLKEVETFTVGKDRELDLFLAPYDVLGSLAHIKMLEKVGLLNTAELTELQKELKNIYKDIDAGNFSLEEG